MTLPNETAGTADPLRLNRAVVECFEALVAVRELVRPTASNPIGDRGPDVARERLDRLRTALLPFPRRRLDLDPFVGRKGTITIPIPDDRPITCSSIHDAILRAVGRLYDSLVLYDLKPWTDPDTGEVQMLPEMTGRREFEEEIDLGGVKKVMLTTSLGSPVVRHYTELPWSPELWERLHEMVCETVLAFLPWGAGFDRIESALQVELQRAIRNTPVLARAGDDHDSTEVNAGGGKKGKNIDARMMKVLANKPESIYWNSMDWADHLKCGDGTVRGTRTWMRHIPTVRSMNERTLREAKKLANPPSKHLE